MGRDARQGVSVWQLNRDALTGVSTRAFVKFVKYSKYVGDPASEMSMEDLLNALSDYLLNSGFQNPYAQF